MGPGSGLCTRVTVNVSEKKTVIWSVIDYVEFLREMSLYGGAFVGLELCWRRWFWEEDFV